MSIHTLEQQMQYVKDHLINYRDKEAVQDGMDRIKELENPWVSVDDRLPEFGSPVLIVADGVAQNITYCLDASDESESVVYWFEPFHFGFDDQTLVIPANKVTHWMKIPSISE